MERIYRCLRKGGSTEVDFLLRKTSFVQTLPNSSLSTTPHTHPSHTPLTHTPHTHPSHTPLTHTHHTHSPPTLLTHTPHTHPSHTLTSHPHSLVVSALEYFLQLTSEMHREAWTPVLLLCFTKILQLHQHQVHPSHCHTITLSRCHTVTSQNAFLY